MTTPTLDHVEFDQMCAEIDEFEPLPTADATSLESDPESEEETSLDSQILAGLVSPC
jgi:hypothetical protein